MRAWPVPVQIEGEERIIGGHLTLRQFIYVILGIALGGGAAFGLGHFSVIVAAAAFFFFAALGAVLAFMRVGDTSLDVYVLRWFAWRFGNREYRWEGDSCD